MEKILIIKLGALGDFVLAIGSMQNIKAAHPNAEFTLMTGAPFVSIAKQMNMFSHYIIDNRESLLNIPYTLRLAKEVRAGDFDKVYDFQIVSRTKYRYFYAMRLLSRKSFIWHTGMKNVTEYHIEKKHPLSFGKCTKIPAKPCGKITDLSFLHGENKYFHELPERFVLFIPGCSPNHPHKRWPVGYFSELAARLAKRNISVVLIGTKTEEEEIKAIAEASPLAVNMINKTSLLDIPDLARLAIASVGNDTGPSHIASLSGMPTIAIYDNRTKQGALTGPRSINLVSPDTIDKITVDHVWEKLLPILEKAGA
ncbi:MAG: glycosyltransferase family 9 protein [Akkermansia sp.]|nr:glycosyltransferase family 9 protein [Akkermansia sp.]